MKMRRVIGASLLWLGCGWGADLEGKDGAAVPADTVVLLHGLGRGPVSMWPLARSLKRQGYQVVNVRYPSQCADIVTLSEYALGPILGEQARARVDGPGVGVRVHIVTHSLGGILVRRYLKDHGVPPNLGRVVMLAPPNAGSEIVDTLGGWALYARINGPAGIDLGTGSDQTPTSLGALPVGVEVGVLAGSFSWNPLFSWLIPGSDDGKVSVTRTHVGGETDHRVLPYSHTWLMNRSETQRQVAAFLADGYFNQEKAVETADYADDRR